MKIAILGAGIAGLSCASILCEKHFEVTVFEKESRVGGLCKSTIVNGYVFDLHGGHIFNSKYDYIREWVFSKLDKSQWHYSVRNAKILYNNKLVSYPFELALAELPTEETIDCLVDFVKPKGDEPDNYHDWLIWNFGQAITERYMIPYNSKIWSYPLKDMSIVWIKGKMPLPSIREVIKASLTKNPHEREMPHSTFYYPLKGGIQTMIDAIAKEVPDIRIGTPVDTIEHIKGKWVINGESQFDHVISTISLRELAKILDMPEKVKEAINSLKYNSLTTTIFESPQTDLSWLYVPSKKYRAHRLVYQSNYAPESSPPGKSSVVLEAIGEVGPEEIVEGFRRDNQVKEVQIGDIIDSSFTQYAYMIFDKDYPKNIEVVDSYFSDLGLKLLGRFAEWKYYNMDICIKRAFEVAEALEQKIGKREL